MATQAQVCYAPPPPISLPPLDNDREVRVRAERTNIVQNDQAQFSGNVEIFNRDALIGADRASVDILARELTAAGQVTYQDQRLQVSSNQIDLGINSGELRMLDTQYQMLEFSGRGEAGQIVLSQTQGVSLQDVSFTTCAPGQEDWIIRASEISLEKDDNWGTVRNARFYLADIPVLYLPYFRFPVTDERESGLLFPTDVSSSGPAGLIYEQPVYWNIAPNYDATFAPRLLSSRGVQLKTEFRYLSRRHRGQLNLEYLDDDRDTPQTDRRYFYRFDHRGVLSDNWVLAADINGISDDNYIVDLGNDYYNRADTHLFQTLNLNYFSESLDFEASFQDFEVIGNNPNGYRAVPQLSLDYRQNTLGSLRFNLSSELTYFDNSDNTLPTATRLHLQPQVQLPYSNQYLEVVAEASLLQTFYQQEQVQGFDLEENVSRSIPQGRLLAALNFERPLKSGRVQTLEPKIQYLYTGFEDQSRIGLYDSLPLLNDFQGLFRGQEFAGLDRIVDQNQVTLGVTTRILDENNREQIRASIGQIFFFEENRVIAGERGDNRSAVAGELDWRISSKWFVHSEFLLSSSNQRFERSNLTVDYQLAKDKIFQIGHRYIRELSGEQIDQIGFTASWPIAKNWLWIGRWYRDLERNRTIESYTGIQYESCCWAINLVAQRSLTNRFDVNGLQGTEEFDSGIALQFVFKGIGRSKSTKDLLGEGLFGYRQPYFLNN